MVELERNQKRREQLDKAAEALCAQFTEVFRPLGFSWFHETHSNHATLSAQQSSQEQLPPEKATDILLGILRECGLTPPDTFHWPHKIGAISLDNNKPNAPIVSMGLTAQALKELVRNVPWINRLVADRVPVRARGQGDVPSLFARGNARYLEL